MESYEDPDESDLNEQIFHNNVREQIVSYFFIIYKLNTYMKFYY